ncbi:hypothetical protein PS1_032494 [Malus domestica]
MANLTTLLSQVMEGPKVQTVAACGVCSMQGHPTDKCPQLIENGGWETLNAVGFGNQYQQRNDPFSNTYNPGTSLDNDTILKLLTTLSQGQENQTKALQKPRQKGGSLGEANWVDRRVCRTVSRPRKTP